MKAYLNEILRFIKKYLSKIIIGGVLLGLLFGGLLYMRTQNNEQTTDELENDLPTTSLENQVEPAYFQFYIVQPNGNIFTNFSVINKVFNSESVTDRVVDTTGINVERIEEIVKDRLEDEGVPPEELDEYSVVEVTIDDSSKILTAVFDSGNKNNNLALANFYYEFLFNERLDILSENSLYSIAEPTLIELSEDLEIDTEEQSPTQQTNSFSLINFIINFIIGIIFSLLLLTVIFLIKELFSKKINFAFTYDRGKQEDFLIYDNSISSSDLVNYFIETPYSKGQIILSEYKLNENIVSNEHLNLNTINNYQSMLNVEKISNIKEIIIVVIIDKTSRNWFEKQLELTKMKNIPTKIVQINHYNE